MDLLEGYGSQNQWEGRRAQLRGGKECFGMGYEWRGYIPKMVSFWRKWCEPVFPPYDTPPKIQSHSRKGIITLESFTPGWEVQCLDFWYHYDHTHWQEILPKEMKELKAMDAAVPKPTDILYSKAETMAVVFREKKQKQKKKDPVDRRLPHSDHILSEPDHVLSDTSHVVRTEWRSLLLRKFCSLKSDQHVIRAGCDLMSSRKPPLPTRSFSLWPLGITCAGAISLDLVQSCTGKQCFDQWQALCVTVGQLYWRL